METSIKESRKAPPAVVREIFSSWPALEPKDIADGLIYALSAPAHVQVHELIIRPLGQELWTFDDSKAYKYFIFTVRYHNYLRSIINNDDDDNNGMPD